MANREQTNASSDKSVNTKKIVYIDMDNVLVDFKSGIEQLSDAVQKEYESRLDEVPSVFALMKPMQLRLN